MRDTASLSVYCRLHMWGTGVGRDSPPDRDWTLFAFSPRRGSLTRPCNQKDLREKGVLLVLILWCHLPPPPPPPLPRGSAGRPKRGSRWVLFSQTAADHQSVKPANLQPALLRSSTPPRPHKAFTILPPCTLSLSLCPLSISRSFFFIGWACGRQQHAPVETNQAFPAVSS